MATLVTTRRSRGKVYIRANATPRTPTHRTKTTAIVKASGLAWPAGSRRFGIRVPDGFMSALHSAFMSPSRISDRVRRIRLVLDLFDQSQDALPTKVRRFLERFDAPEHGR